MSGGRELLLALPDGFGADLCGGLGAGRGAGLRAGLGRPQQHGDDLLQGGGTRLLARASCLFQPEGCLGLLLALGLLLDLGLLLTLTWGLFLLLGLRGGYGLAPPGYHGLLRGQAALQHREGLLRRRGGSGEQVQSLLQGAGRLGGADVGQQLGFIAEGRAEAGAVHAEVLG